MRRGRVLQLLLLPFVSAALIKQDPAGGDELTSDTFEPSVSKGLWFIKFYSPSCGHCKKLAPFWEQAEKNINGKKQGIALASVNCIAQNDVCAAQGVQGYPTMNLYRDGKKIADLPNMVTDDPLGMIETFVKEQLKMAKSPSSETVSSPKEAATGTIKLKEAPKQKDMVPAPPQKTVPNIEGRSMVLTTDNFKQHVTDSKDVWFIKFYTTWCSHCKAMAPSWQELAATNKGKLNIGEVDCDKESKLCKDAGVRGYPTLLVFQGTQHVDYNGLRGLGDLVAFANKAASSQVKDVDATDFEGLQKKNEVVFLYFYDYATTTEDFEALDRTSLSLIGHAPLVKTSNEILASKFRVTTFPQLAVIKDRKPQYYNALGPADMRDTSKMISWMKANWLPLVPELSAQTSHEIMSGHRVVLAILDPDVPSFDLQKQVLKDAAQKVNDDHFAEEQAEKLELREKKEDQLREALKGGDKQAVERAKQIRVKVEGSPEVGFAWVNGIFWSKWLKATYNIDLAVHGSRVLIADDDASHYWDVDAKGKSIPVGKEAILSAISQVMHGNLKPKSTKSSLDLALQNAKRVGEHPIKAGVLVFGSLAIVVAILTRRAIRRRLREQPNDHAREELLTGKLD
ncbi:thioredoxin-like protein [Protomyces lactucae-debilis]|uniref:Thioredoxin-like protein n=1 Tax=Protomyces lactucae-debilis TaxID=2754530 RepID=A0A1Y2FDL7_PROLT|nr:thioredoxin-like protein [Protomyces lactucae-debilis]ORY82009.1 thioredoxin-like protein [Protomyces lactucae-debilis]